LIRAISSSWASAESPGICRIRCGMRLMREAGVYAVPGCWSFRKHPRSSSCVVVVAWVERPAWCISSMAPRHWIVAFRKHVLPMLHIPRPGVRGGEFVATFPSVSCRGCGSAFPLRVGSRRVSVSGREVKAGEEVVGATPGVWLLGSGVASRRG